MGAYIDLGELGKVRLSGLDLLFGQALFKRNFFTEHPQCKGCERVDVLVMDYQLYPAAKKSHCEVCEKYKGW